MSGNGVFRIWTALRVPGFGLKNFIGLNHRSAADLYGSHKDTRGNDPPEVLVRPGSVLVVLIRVNVGAKEILGGRVGGQRGKNNFVSGAVCGNPILQILKEIRQ
jgi:hypothetical protein